MSRFNFQFNAGHVFGVLADDDARDAADVIAARAELELHVQHSVQSDFIAGELATFGGFEYAR